MEIEPHRELRRLESVSLAVTGLEIRVSPAVVAGTMLGCAAVRMIVAAWHGVIRTMSPPIRANPRHFDSARIRLDCG